MDYPYIKNSELIRDFQIEAVNWLEKKEGVGLLAVCMGAGKCLISIIYTTKHNLKTLIICPKSVVYVWQDEIGKWSYNDCSIISSKSKELDFSKDFTIINYDIVYKHLPLLQEQNFDCVIIDESHLIKNQTSRRSKAVKKLNIPKKILLTGTPITNKPLDLWNQLNYIAPDYWASWIYFRNTFIQGFYHPHFGYFVETGTKNISQLSERIKPFVFRKRKEDILKELPPKIYNKIIVDLDKEHLNKYMMAIEDFENFLQSYTELTKEEIYHRLRGEAFAKIQAVKQICSNFKVDTLIIKEIVDDILENNPTDKIVIFSQYRNVVKNLYAQLSNAVLVHGEIDNEKRAMAVREFQENPKTNIFIGTIQTSGVGITLTKASHVIFLDLMWNPSDHQQAEDRSHRLGTTNKINIFYIISKNTIEETIYNLLNKKQSTIDQIIDRKEFERPVNIYDQFLRDMIKKVK